MTYGFLKTAMRGLLAAATLAALAAPALAQGSDSATIRELQRVIGAQQKQIAAQSKLLENLSRRVEALAKSSQAAAATANRAQARIEKVETDVKAGTTGATVGSGQDNVSLAISGQVNRAVMYVGDGNNAEVFHVDNDNSSTRVRFVGTGKVNEDITLGANIEVQMESNSSSSVSQTSDSGVGGASFTERLLELYADSAKFGRIWLGQGSTASDGIAGADLSGTGVIAYSGIADLAGGMTFYNPVTKSYGPAIGAVHSDFDGLSRNDRIRYDTPEFSGLQFSTSQVSGGAWDAALFYAADYGEVQVAAGLGYANQASLSTSEQDRIAGSVSLRHKSGFNVTFAAGANDQKAAARNDADYYYGKLGYIAKIFKIGNSSFAIDYTRADDVAQNSDEATSYGIFAVQDLSEYGAQFYLGARNHELNRPGSSFDDILAIMGGARIKF